MVEENTARNSIKHKDNPALKDLISRAYGILFHSYQIEAVEAMNALSLMKLGLQLEWIGNTTILALNQLFFNCRRAHLLRLFPEKISQEEVAHKRAEYIHQSLKGVTLLI